MASLEQLKKEIKEEASQNPEKFFATDILKAKGFSRGQCKKCGMHFWSLKEREICGEPECGKGYTFINNSPTKETFTHTESWEKFQEFMQSRDYASIDRYPVVARWRGDVEFTGASIYCFQPHVVSGEAEPPAKELIIPQPSLRFNDVDNVGVTGRHFTNFTMIGQACFQPPEEYDQDRYFKDMFEYTSETLGIPQEKMIFHEEAWGGGGNLGPCMECFIDGLELWNQVYMFYKQTPEGYEELDLQVLDMGMGHERITWISNGTQTSYESVMPETIKKMKKRIGLETNKEIWEKFLPQSSELNVDEVDDIDEKWREIAEKIDVDVDELKNEIKPAAALYSVAEHTRALIFALADGKIPSNTGGGHNLRMIYRRAKDFLEKYDWNVNLAEVARWNAEELEPMFPELLESMDEIEEILDVEAEKYEKAREKAQKKLSKLDKQPSVEKMVELYESHGVSPEMMEEAGFEVPEDFYMKLGNDEEVLHEAEEDFDLEGVKETEKLYYKRREPYRKEENLEFEAKVAEIIEDKWIILDRTLFYPQGGGQAYDTGEISGFEVEDVQKQSGVVLHQVPDHDLKQGDLIIGKVNGERRKQLTQHHSTTHMVNAAAREELGEHIYQAGANKTTEKARLDITHYEKPNRETLDEIEKKVRKIIEENHDIDVLELPKSEAEQEYGFRIYQGGAPPGNTIRLIDIKDVDIEACGGTHLTKSSNAEEFIITGCKRIQDGVIRLEYKAGETAVEYIQETERIVEKCIEHLEEASNSKELNTDKSAREIQRNLSEIFSVNREDLTKTLKRFREETSDKKQTIEALCDYLEMDRQELEIKGKSVENIAKSLFEVRKDLDKTIEDLETHIKNLIRQKAEKGEPVTEEVPTENIGLLIQICQEFANKYGTQITLIGEKGAVSASGNEEYSAAEKLRELGSENVQGDDSFAKAFDISRE